MLDVYLRELEGELAKRLPPEDVRARLAEIAAHLQESVAAHREFGLDERKAFEDMGDPCTLARGLTEVATEKVHRRRLWSAGISLLLFGVYVAVRENYGPGPLTSLTAVGGYAGLFGTVFGSFRARRHATRSLAIVALILVLPVALVRAGISHELPLPGSARPAEGLGEASIIYRPYGPERNLQSLTYGSRTYRIADLQKDEVPFARRVAHQSLLALGDSALNLMLVGSVDAAGAWLGIVVLAARRRRRKLA